MVLSRRPGESIKIGDNITITVVDVDRNKVRIGIDTGRDMPVVRTELLPPDGVRRKDGHAQARDKK